MYPFQNKQVRENDEGYPTEDDEAKLFFIDDMILQVKIASDPFP